jgi:hypothetical protein
MFKKVIKMQCMITQKFDDPKTPKELFISQEQDKVDEDNLLQTFFLLRRWLGFNNNLVELITKDPSLPATWQ